MAYDVIIGRSESQRKKYGDRGMLFLGKTYVQMGQTVSLSNRIFIDVAGAHVLFICGKRGGGKSYTMGVVAEGVADLDPETRQNLSFIFLDTMGVYWTMKYPNKKEPELLEMWGLESKPVDVVIYTPVEYYHKYKKMGIPTDKPFSIKPAELSSADWCTTFEIDENDPMGVLIERVIGRIKKEKPSYSLKDVTEYVQSDMHAPQNVKDAVENRFTSAERWGVFDEAGTEIGELAKGGQITILDVSCYATMPNGWRIKQLIVGLVSMHLFVQRMVARKDEEFKQVKNALNYFSAEDTSTDKQEMPLVWLVIDEAHEFLPKAKEDINAATMPLVTIMREGRQPGISLILATQQPGKIHSDVMTQSDIVLSTRITAKLDVEALSVLSAGQAGGIIDAMNSLPRDKGSCVIFDDTNERIYQMRIRPRFTWHGGESPSAVHTKKDAKF
ncbi:ATP-binding protein [Candidatus Woesearchaeota archaeon]|nr:ATP-binding protein [Candidatus Woesearchaeota archaeon]